VAAIFNFKVRARSKVKNDHRNGLPVLENLEKEVLHMILVQLIKQFGVTTQSLGKIQDGRHAGVTYHLTAEHLGVFVSLGAY
jgi:hypothetical protein